MPDSLNAEQIEQLLENIAGAGQLRRETVDLCGKRPVAERYSIAVDCGGCGMFGATPADRIEERAHCFPAM